MERLKGFEHHQFVGDKRTQLVYDVDAWTDEATLAELMDSEQFICFAPDSLAEARNRGYRLAT